MKTMPEVSESVDFNMNMDMRSAVLQGALNVEKFVTELIVLYLDVSKEKSKAFGNESSNIAFSDKLNILLDTGIFRENGKALKVHDECVLISQIRNKVVHVYECNTIISTLKMIKGSAEKLAAYFDEELITQADEKKYTMAYLKLCMECQKTLIKMIHDKEIKKASKVAMVDSIIRLYKIELNEGIEYKDLLFGFVSLDCTGDPKIIEAYQKRTIEKLKLLKHKGAEDRKEHNKILRLIIDNGYTTDILTETL